MEPQVIGSFFIYKVLENTPLKVKGRTIYAITELCLSNSFYFEFFSQHANRIRTAVPIDDFN